MSLASTDGMDQFFLLIDFMHLSLSDAICKGCLEHVTPSNADSCQAMFKSSAKQLV